MPLLIHAVLRPFRMHGFTVQHARLADREVADVDHLLHFAQCFALDLADLQLHQSREICFMGAQLLT